MTDPLHRSASADEKAKTGPWYRGFHTAMMRKRPIPGNEPSLGSMIFSGFLTSLPIVGLFYLQLRARHTMQMPMTTKKKSVMDDMQKMMQNMYDPMGHKNFRIEVKDTKFKDVIAIPEALADVRQYVDFLKTPDKVTRLGGRIPRGCLLTGQPGTGKTLLAKAVAGEAGVPFFTCSGADFIEVYVGSGPKRVRELFEEARAAAPSVIFLDEIDAVGSRGGNHSAGGVNQEENRTINQLLAEMDGLGTNEAVVVFAATNFLDVLDKALLREGRFDRKIEIPMPDLDARKELFLHYLSSIITGDAKGRLAIPPPQFAAAGSNPQPGAAPSSSQAPQDKAQAQGETVKADPSVSNEKIAAELAGLTPSLSPATIATIVNEAALAAAVAGDQYVTLKHLRPAIDDVVVGKKQRIRMGTDAAARVALHEAGHATVAWLLPQQTKVIKISITPRGRAAGFTQQLGREVLDSITDRMLFTDICVMLGGRCAELMQYQNLTTGAQDDLQRATQNALQQFLVMGMSDNLGLLSFDHNRIGEGRMYQLNSDRSQYEAELEASKLIDAAFHVTKQLLETNREKLLALTEALMEKKEMVENDIEKVLGPRLNDALAPLPPFAVEALNRFLTRASDVGSLPPHLQQKVKSVPTNGPAKIGQSMAAA